MEKKKSASISLHSLAVLSETRVVLGNSVRPLKSIAQNEGLYFLACRYA